MDMMLTVDRLQRLTQELKTFRYSHIMHVDSIEIAPCTNSYDKPGVFKSFENGGSWGEYDKHFWFRIKFTIPEIYQNRTVVLLVSTGKEGEWDATNPQFLAFVNGKLVQGMDVNHTELIIADNAKANEEYVIDLHAYSGLNEGKSFFRCSAAVLEKEVEELYYDIKVPLDALECLSKNDKRYVDILGYLKNTVALIDFRKAHGHDETFMDSVKRAIKYIKENFYEKYCGNEDVIVSGIGHTHIDVAWLWTLSQTREKAVRSFSTVLELMKRYPEYRFMSSQPQLYEFVKENRPDLYDKIRSKVKEGSWDPEGAMWLEADCNLTSGESIIRQILFGKRFFYEEFGVDSKILWLPDVFGYSAALPQILNKCGINCFITSKISWNEYNKMPYDAFMWQGIDGSKILTYFITTPDPGQDYENNHRTTYVGMVKPYTILGTWERFQQKEATNNVLIPYGYGDGGGGPTRDMIEYGKRLSKGIPGIPKFRFSTLKEFMNDFSAQVEKNKDLLPNWVGELYLEYHRGTYTSMARNKKYNRIAEFMLMETEGLYTMLKTLLGEEYPTGALNKAWKTVLLNQFHDILPGSSIKSVYEESKAQYEVTIKELENLSSKAMQKMIENIGLSSQALVVFNPTGFAMGNIIETSLPDWCHSVKSEDGRLLPVQISHDNKALVYVPFVSPKGYSVYELCREEADVSGSAMIIDSNLMENDFYRVELDTNGVITSIYDKLNEREVIKQGEKANKIVAYEDIPIRHDAWDINIYYKHKCWEVLDADNIKVLERGPVRMTLRIERAFLDSRITQYIQLYRDIPRIDFRTRIDWKERNILLKAHFPVDINASNATYDIQFGNIERPTHWNTSWDMAKFEACAHKWADLSENGYGVSLLNDCKYGYDIKDGIMSITLLKSATYPNEDADREIHEFTYSLLPHRNDFRDCTVKQGYALNMPFRALVAGPNPGNLPENLSFAFVEGENVVLETIKRAENGEGIILRMYEAYNRRGKAVLKLPVAVRQAFECNMLEENISPLAVVNNSIHFEIRPYEIKTIRILTDGMF